jgi:hypothetical protein
MRLTNRIIDIEVFKESDFEEYSKWVKSQGHIVPEFDYLPSGYNVYVNDKKIVSGFVYMDLVSDSAFIEWIYFNPDAKASDKYVAVDVLIKTLKDFAILNGKRFITAGSNCSGIIKRFKKNGFTEILKNATHLALKIVGV